MSCISIQKKPTLWGELLMVFINSLYKLYISIPYGAIIFTKIQKYFYKTNSI